MPDGAVVWGDLSLAGVRDAGGALTVVIAQIVDATEAVEARRALATHREVVPSAGENAPTS